MKKFQTQGGFFATQSEFYAKSVKTVRDQSQKTKKIQKTRNEKFSLKKEIIELQESSDVQKIYQSKIDSLLQKEKRLIEEREKFITYYEKKQKQSEQTLQKLRQDLTDLQNEGSKKQELNQSMEDQMHQLEIKANELIEKLRDKLEEEKKVKEMIDKEEISFKENNRYDDKEIMEYREKELLIKEDIKEVQTQIEIQRRDLKQIQEEIKKKKKFNEEIGGNFDNLVIKSGQNQDKIEQLQNRQEDQDLQLKEIRIKNNDVKKRAKQLNFQEQELDEQIKKLHLQSQFLNGEIQKQKKKKQEQQKIQNKTESEILSIESRLKEIEFQTNEDKKSVDLLNQQYQDLQGFVKKNFGLFEQFLNQNYDLSGVLKEEHFKDILDTQENIINDFERCVYNINQINPIEMRFFDSHHSLPFLQLVLVDFLPLLEQHFPSLALFGVLQFVFFWLFFCFFQPSFKLLQKYLSKRNQIYLYSKYKNIQWIHGSKIFSVFWPKLDKNLFANKRQ